jgi:hypothetical protein
MTAETAREQSIYIYIYMYIYEGFYNKANARFVYTYDRVSTCGSWDHAGPQDDWHVCAWESVALLCLLRGLCVRPASTTLNWRHGAWQPPVFPPHAERHPVRGLGPPSDTDTRFARLPPAPTLRTPSSQASAPPPSTRRTPARASSCRVAGSCAGAETIMVRWDS